MTTTPMTMKESFVRRFANMYVEGFRSMTIGRKLWLLILVKLFLFFAVLKLFFFPDILERDYNTDAERADAVRQHLAAPADNNTIEKFKQ